MVYYSTHLQQHKLLQSNYSALAENLVLKLPKPPKNSGMESVNNYCKKYNLKEKLIFANIQSN